MPPRFDPDSLTVELSVADLLEASLVRSLGFANRGGYERLWLGQAIHSRYQEEALERDPTYQREVGLRLELEHRGWRVRVFGRVDGLRREADGTAVVEEIKSVRRGGQLAPQVREVYERQAALYAWMLRRLEERPVRAELVLIEIGGEDVERAELELDLEAVAAAVKRRLNTLIRGFEGERQRLEGRRQAASRLAFPYPELRPGQEEIMAAVEEALAARGHLLVEAATGIGKTVAALLPALRHTLAEGKRLFVLTAKTLQQEMAVAVLEQLNPEADFHSLRLRAKAKMCANDEILCHEEYCPYARDYYLKLHRTGLEAALLDEHGHLEPDLLFARARAEEVCPFEVSLDLVDHVQVVVGDYNYVFDPYVALSAFGADAELTDTILLVDEIHNLVDRGRRYYSPELDAGQARAVAEHPHAGAESLARRIRELAAELAGVVEQAVDAALEEGPPGDRAVEGRLPEDELWALRPELDALFVDLLEHRRETKSFSADDPFVDLYFRVLRFLNGLALPGGELARCLERRGGTARLRIFCKDPSAFLGRLINGVQSVIGLSATLSPPEFYRDLLGFDAERTRSLRVPNPFPAENRRVVIDTRVATTWRERPANAEPIARRLTELADAVPGNCLVLFPSYDFMAQVAERVKPASKRVLLQQRTDSDGAREALLETLRSALLGDVLLLAVAGGVFAEGVDYPGDMLRAVAVVGPCLPGIGLEQDLLRAYYEERFERGFEYAFVVPGMTRVVQAAGRLIRSSEDTGVIALLDRRFLQEPYVRHLPPEWLPAEDPSSLVGDPAEAARAFFRQLREA